MMSMTRVQLLSLAAACGVVAGGLAMSASSAAAQGTLSAQGLGYPPGQLSTRALGTGGAIGEFDSHSPLNPAALAIGTFGIELYGQYDPELRSVSGPNGKSNTVTSRVPNFGLIVPLGRRMVLGFNASTFLDRTWATQSTRTQNILDSVVSSNETLKSQGGIADLQAGIGYAFTSFFRLGVAAHYFTGTNSIQLLQQFPDTVTYSNISQTSKLDFRGSAISAGAEVDLPLGVSLAGSGRFGNSIRMSSVDTLNSDGTEPDTVLSRGKIPNNYAVSLGYSGIPGTFVAVRYGVDRWQSLQSLSLSGATAVQTSDFSVGLESTGPKTGSQAIVFRLGARFRTLPFQVSGSTVTEHSFGGGVGLPISGGRAMLDLGVLRSARTGVSGVTENAYNLSFGLRIHP